MPIVDIELVCASKAEFGAVSATAAADAVGDALGCAPGRAWVRLRCLDRDGYAENRTDVGPSELPVFVTVLLATLPPPAELASHCRVLTQAVAAAVGRPADRVHVQYAPAGAGRQAFGGELVRPGR